MNIIVKMTFPFLLRTIGGCFDAVVAIVVNYIVVTDVMMLKSIAKIRTCSTIFCAMQQLASGCKHLEQLLLS